MKKKILFFTFFVLVILIITTFSSSISSCIKQQDFSLKSKVRFNQNLNEKNYIIKTFVVYFLYGQIENWEINESHDEDGNWTYVSFDCINLMFICFGHIDKFPWWIFLIKININDRFTIPYLNDTLEFKGTFEDNFICGFIIARPNEI